MVPLALLGLGRDFVSFSDHHRDVRREAKRRWIGVRPAEHTGQVGGALGLAIFGHARWRSHPQPGPRRRSQRCGAGPRVPPGLAGLSCHDPLTLALTLAARRGGTVAEMQFDRADGEQVA